MRLFDAISGGRPEHVAKGALAFLIQESSGVQQRLKGALGLESADVDLVETEVVQGSLRSDIVIHWSAGYAPSHLELKLGAPYTTLQLRQLNSLIVVAPRGTRKAEGLAKLIELEFLTDGAKDSSDRFISAARCILEQACEAYGWYREELPVATLLQEAKSIFDERGPTRNWAELYRFLCQIDLHLTDGAAVHELDYHANERMKPATRGRHYGYYFQLGAQAHTRKPWWWVGVEYPAGEDACFSFYVSETKREMNHLKPGQTVLHAAEIATYILNHALAQAKPD